MADRREARRCSPACALIARRATCRDDGDGLGQREPAQRVSGRVRTMVLAVNVGEHTVQAILAALVSATAPWDQMPPIAVPPIGRTNLIAPDVGAEGDPIA